MSLRLASVLLFVCCSAKVHAADTVSLWLGQMGCDTLLAAYLEEKLESGDQKTKVIAAKELANLYALLLSRADDIQDAKILKRATSLLERLPDVGTTELRLQLLRASYLSAEQMLERYRLRFTTREKADVAAAQLEEIIKDLSRIQDHLKRQASNTRRDNEDAERKYGLASSLLAWSEYYVAWHRTDQLRASNAASHFSKMLGYDTPSLSNVSLDLNSREFGARAILGIALCKDITKDPEGPLPWFEAIDTIETWSEVRSQIPMWKFFLDVDHKRWNKVLQGMSDIDGVDIKLLLRLAAVHAMEHFLEPSAQKVAQESISTLISMGQLSMVSEIVKTYGFDSLPIKGFITKYIQGDHAYRIAQEQMVGDLPTDDLEVRQLFSDAASIFKEAKNAADVPEFPAIIDDCTYMLGLSLYYASEFEKATVVFHEGRTGKYPEKSIWMAIVSIEQLSELPQSLQMMKDKLIEKYIASWPNTDRATQLLLHQTGDDEQAVLHIDDLLAVPYTDPRYEDAQRQAARYLYRAWRTVLPEERADVGNRYITVAVPIMISDFRLINHAKAAQRASVRAFRVLEIALHPEIQRLIAAQNAFDVLDEVKEQRSYDYKEQFSELHYRHVLDHLYNNAPAIAIDVLEQMCADYANDQWTKAAAKAIWYSWEESTNDVESNKRYLVGMQLIYGMTNQQLTTQQTIHFTLATAKAGYDLFLDGEVSAGEQALRLSRILVAALPKNETILILNAKVEQDIGDRAKSLQHWRVIASGSKKGSALWLEAKYNVITILAKQAPEDALKVLDQHFALYPDYGGEPYGSRLKILHENLRGNNAGS